MAVGGNPSASYLLGLSKNAPPSRSTREQPVRCLWVPHIRLHRTGLDRRGEPYTLNSIASSVIGGTPFTGGEGTLAGSFGGALIMTVIQAILTGLNTGDAGRMISQGLVIIVMVSIYQRRAK